MATKWGYKTAFPRMAAARAIGGESPFSGSEFAAEMLKSGKQMIKLGLVKILQRINGDITLDESP